MPETLEAEVIEIDGKAPDPASQAGPSASYSDRARQVVLKLDRRWWPLWAVVGIVAVAAVATLGVVFGVIYLVFAIVRGFFRALGFGDR